MVPMMYIAIITIAKSPPKANIKIEEIQLETTDTVS